MMRWVRIMKIKNLMDVGLVVSCGLGISLLGVAQSVEAEPLGHSQSHDGLSQAPPPTLVLPFTDVSPDHWAYQALLNLAGTYGCVSGYPDSTFRGDTAMTRYEFAAGMNSCLGSLTDLVNQPGGTTQQEVDALIEDMEGLLQELRQLEQRLPEADQ
jgi:hypothetical protein